MRASMSWSWPARRSDQAAGLEQPQKNGYPCRAVGAGVVGRKSSSCTTAIEHDTRASHHRASSRLVKQRSNDGAVLFFHLRKIVSQTSRTSSAAGSARAALDMPKSRSCWKGG